MRQLLDDKACIRIIVDTKEAHDERVGGNLLMDLNLRMEELESTTVEPIFVDGLGSNAPPGGTLNG